MIIDSKALLFPLLLLPLDLKKKNMCKSMVQH